MMARSVTLLLVVASTVVDGREFLGVSKIDISEKIQGALDGMLGSGHGVDDSRLRSIRLTLEPIFSVLPKNNRGRLSPAFFRYAVRRYFSQRYGWVIKGFEPNAGNTSNLADVQGARFMKDKIPAYVEAVVEKKLSHAGFELQDMVTAVAAFEALIFDENVDAVEISFLLNLLEPTQPINIAPNLTHVLASYFLIEQMGGNQTDIAAHWMGKQKLRDSYPNWGETFMMIQTIILEDLWSRQPSHNPFLTAPSFAFEDVVRIAQTFSEHFGRFANQECNQMKIKLAGMDPHVTGRVKLADFYQSSKGSTMLFLETAEYLDTIGALDNSSDHLGPQVIIPNYITGANNCMSSPLYYDICCMNECEGIYQHLESRIKGPTASAGQIQKLIEEGIATSPLLSSTAPIEPRNLSVPLLNMLQQVGEHHHDVIPLHGRLFAQWLHYAFPHECPYPHMSSQVSGWQAPRKLTKRMQLAVKKDEMEQFIDSETGRPAPSPDAGLDMWIMHEELLDSHNSAWGWTSSLRKVVPILGLLSFAAILLKQFVRFVRVGSSCHGGAAKKIVEYNV